ncbi:MAG TPA: hypothetical protein VHM65_08920, partial [Candidatus Lustribacter sp.]|nr:hypothetical protein [Candidatus Lustribacter sp.]
MRMRPDEVTSPSAQDSLVRSAAEVAGGPQGRYAAPRSWRRVGAVLVGLSSVPLALGVLERGHCISAGWNTPDQFWHACFSDLTTTYAGTGLSSGPSAYLFGMADAATPSQPPLTGLIMTGVAALVPDAPLDERMRWYFALWAVLAAVLVSVVVWMTTASVPRHPVRAAQVALSPLVALTLFVAPDVVGVALVSGALLAWGRRRPPLAGVLLGLAISARTYPLVILAALLFVCLRGGR